MARMLILLLVTAFAVWGGILAQEDEETLESEFYYTYASATGNRFIDGRGTFPDVQTFDMELGGRPMWVVGAVTAADDLTLPASWAVALENGDLQGTYLGEANQIDISLVLEDYLPGGMPPVFTVNEIGAFIEPDLPSDLSPLTHVVSTTERIVYVATNGDVVLLNGVGDEMVRLPFDALPDARIVLDSGQTRAAVYVGATDQRYVHGIMGDQLEGVALMIVELENGNVPTIIELEGDEVFEGIAPIWADVDGDGEDDLITTVSSGASGAQIRAYRATDGSLLASGPAIGQGERWRHQLAWGPFGPSGENELAEVLTPHIGGVVGFYRYDGADGLEIVAQTEGYTSHVIDSRNLDMAVGGDFDGDGQPEIVLPNQARTQIAGLQHVGNGEIAERWTLPLDGELITNLAPVTLPNGQLALAAGVDDGGVYRLRVWLP